MASAFAAAPAGAVAGAALLWPEHVPTIPEATCGPYSDRWQQLIQQQHDENPGDDSV